MDVSEWAKLCKYGTENNEVMKLYWYILFVNTGREHKVERILKERLDAELFLPFVPLFEKLFKISGAVKKELVPLFPGYVFVESKVPGQVFIKLINSKINDIYDLIKILKYSDTEIAMRDSERQMLMSLCNGEHCIESSRGVISGDKIHITSGALKGLETIVRKVNRHKRLAWIGMEFMGEMRLVKIALEIVEKV